MPPTNTGKSPVRDYPKLQLGNQKLGSAIWTFNLPQLETCPGASKVCEQLCYASKGRFTYNSVKKSYTYNLQQTKQLIADRKFVDHIDSYIKRNKIDIVRWHSSGDFYSVQYVKDWAQIVKKNPNTRFYGYSRSWRDASIRVELEKLVRYNNVRLFFSCDQDTGIPDKVPDKIRIAYLVLDNNDIPDNKADLVFVPIKYRKPQSVRRNGVLVCPLENGKGWKGDCGTCRICISSLEDKDPRRMKRAADSTRIPLQTISI